MADTATDNAMADAMADAAADSAMADTAFEGAGGDAADLPAPAPALSPEAERFSVELEFVQCLASPSYLHFLAQNEYFDTPEFIAYLSYLLYWRTPEYARFIVFPHALYFLRLLQEKPFRDALRRADYSIMLHQQQGYYWQFEKTMKLRTGTENGETVGVPAEDDDNSAAMDLDADEADAAPPPPKEIAAMEAAAV